MLGSKKSLFLTLLTLVAFLLSGCGEDSTPTTIPAATIPSTTQSSPANLDLNYPGGLKLTEKDIWPTGRPDYFQNNVISGFISKDSWQQVFDFYAKKLFPLGYKVEPSYTCLEPGVCREVYTFDATLYNCQKNAKGNSYCSSIYQIDFLVANSKASVEERQKMNLPDQWFELIKPGQTLILFNARAEKPQPQLELENTTTAAVAPTYTPQPKPTP